MRYYALISTDGDSRLTVEPQDGLLLDLTSVDPDLTDLEDLALAAALTRTDVDGVASGILESGDADRFDLGEVMDNSRRGEGFYRLDRPFEPPEVWAAGVTYKTSEMERRRESDTPDIYSSVFAAERPEVFLKATPERCVGPFDPVGIRGDSEWNVPEPELAFVLYRGDIIGYTIGNDVSSRSIEGENPLYLPQAKVFDQCCSIGPCFVSAASVGDVANLGIQCTITREGVEVWRDQTSTSLMARSCEELADWVQRHNYLPNMSTVLTGTPIVPPPEFTLLEDDVVTITIDGIGALENDVQIV
ncbi:MAG: fumarylacetoacetate hydrolase [SAR202 cluster bacterium]|nr:fumarylacetoacetate hydrolase [Chloroflexota bacterium]MDP6419726.1 fumarylacetoacetate hydrolase family protein [SAR202 cluster bacterium]MDP6663938.1 fumarylacetoacetate hydrolase family protein [SAR202 cluster bacterium]MDP6798910.1 fumarylacetoacetate hydrolase family protein [SAR202 cluster bacterium]MQG58792.1 fumarylacetoacetate hydrolase [SAR202 cluster bacterium]